MRFLYVYLFLFIISCKPKNESINAQQIIDATIQNSGASKVSSSKISFKFRDKSYEAFRKNGRFKLSRRLKNDTITIEDYITNTSYQRSINNTKLSVNDSLKRSYSNAINSVHYFSVLPFGLNDAAVQKRILPSRKIAGKDYYKVEVTFKKNGGGEDYNDVFIYWVGKKDFLIDFLAYSFHTNGGGKRFRVVGKQHFSKGIRFVDYINYKPTDNEVKLIDLDIAFTNNKLQKVSDIHLEDIDVKLID